MQLRKPTGIRKKSVITTDKPITLYRKISMSHPMQSSRSGQSFIWHGYIKVSAQEARMASRHMTSETRKTRKLEWFLTPTQLLSQGQ